MLMDGNRHHLMIQRGMRLQQGHLLLSQDQRLLDIIEWSYHLSVFQLSFQASELVPKPILGLPVI